MKSHHVKWVKSVLYNLFWTLIAYKQLKKCNKNLNIGLKQIIDWILIEHTIHNIIIIFMAMQVK